MPYELELEKQFQTLWKIKIFDKERLEPPHATLIKKGVKGKWRWDLRKKKFMDKNPAPSDVPKDLVEKLMSEETHDQLVKAWDKMFAHNPVASTTVPVKTTSKIKNKARKKKKK